MIKKSSCALLVYVILITAVLTGDIACQKKTETATKNGSKKNRAEKTRKVDRRISASVLKKLGIVKEPRSSVTLEIQHVYSPGISHLGSLAAALEAYDSRLVITKVVFYSGPIYEQQQQTGDEKDTIIMLPMRPETVLLSAIDNLGYRAYIGYNRAGFSKLKKTYLKDEDEAFDFLKRLLSSGLPVIVQIDKKFIGEKTGNEFVVVIGYDNENVYINDPFKAAEEGGNNRAIGIADFLDAWGSGEVAKTPNLMLFVERVRRPKPDVEILAELKKECRVISSYLNKDADNLEKGKMSVADFQSFADLSGAKRSALVVFLREMNFNNVAEYYNQIAILYAEMRQETDPKEGAKKLRQVAKEEKKASKNWR